MYNEPIYNYVYILAQKLQKRHPNVRIKWLTVYNEPVYNNLYILAQKRQMALRYIHFNKLGCIEHVIMSRLLIWL